MAKRTKLVYFLIAHEVLERERGCGAVLDMLRYDAARVLSNAPPRHYLFCNEHGPTVGRWASFGIPIAWQGGSETEAWCYFHGGCKVAPLVDPVSGENFPPTTAV